MTEDEHQDEIQRVTPSSPNFKTELAKKLQELVPEAITDGKVDTKKLKELLDEDTADDSERFGLFWPGKKRAMRAAQEPTTATLKPVEEESKDWDTTENIFIEGDNLEVLKILQKYYHNKIKMIYIDPPYNTGKDFVYPDNYKEGLANYLEFTKQVDEHGRRVSTNSDTNGRYHSNWLNMMYPRLKLARNLLSNDGVIFISIDDNEQSNLKKLCDEVFGEDNFVGTLTVENNPKGRKNAKYVSVSSEFCIVYVKNSSDPNSKFIESVPKGEYRIDEKGRPYTHGKRVLVGRSTNNEAKIGSEKNYTVYYDAEKQNIELRVEGLSEADENLIGRGFVRYVSQNSGVLLENTYTKQKLIELFDNNALIFKKDSIYEKDFNVKKRIKSILVSSDEFDYKTETAGVHLGELSKYFDFPKNTGLIRSLASLVDDKNCLILDFFSGSATTAHAVMQLNAEDGGNRKHIQVQLPEPTDEKSEAFKAGFKTIADISKERIRRAGDKIKKDFADKLAEREKPLDVGFKVFKLSDTNFSKWQTNSDVNVDAVQQRLLDMRESSDDDATQEDLLTEILIKLGFPLTVKVSETNIDGMNIWDVSDKALIAYLDERKKPTLEQLRSLADTDPGKIVVLEDCFQGDDELKTNLAQICKTNNIELLTV